MGVTLPVLINDLQENLVINTIKDLFPDMDVAVIQLLLDQIVTVRKNSQQPTTSAKSALLELASAEPLKGQKALSSCFVPLATEAFTFYFTGGPPEQGNPKLSMNKVELSYDADLQTWAGFPMTGGQVYLLEADFAPSLLQFSTPQTLLSTLGNSKLIPVSKASQTAKVHKAISHVAETYRNLCLGIEELQYMARGKARHTMG